MKITRIPRKRDLHKKRVAAYCRVSTLLENQEDSFETQVSYYTAFIESNEEWEFAGIYSDEKSGTKADNRPGFQQMVLDALEGRVDYILVKSVSRFSRNIVDCQKYVKLLHGNGVEVRFEKENLDTSDPSCSACCHRRWFGSNADTTDPADSSSTRACWPRWPARSCPAGPRTPSG